MNIIIRYNSWHAGKLEQSHGEGKNINEQENWNLNCHSLCNISGVLLVHFHCCLGILCIDWSRTILPKTKPSISYSATYAQQFAHFICELQYKKLSMRFGP